MRRTDPITADGYLRVLAKPAARATVPTPSSTKPVIMIHACCASKAASALMSSCLEAVLILDKAADEPGDRKGDRAGHSKLDRATRCGLPSCVQPTARVPCPKLIRPAK